MNDKTNTTEKSAKEIERESIKVESIINNDETETKETEVETKGEESNTEGSTEEKGETEQDTTEAIEENEEEIEELEKEKKAAATEKEKAKVQKKIDRLHAKNKEYEEKIAALEREVTELKTNGDKKLTEEDVNKAAEAKANEKAFNDMCNRMVDEAEKINKDFLKLVDENAKLLGPIPAPLIHMMDELGNGGAILNYLMVNEDEAEEIYKLSAPKAAVRLTKISEELKAKAKPRVSRVPPPIDPIKGSTEKAINLNAKMSDAEWIEARKKDVAQKRQSGQRPNLY